MLGLTMQYLSIFIAGLRFVRSKLKMCYPAFHLSNQSQRKKNTVSSFQTPFTTPSCKTSVISLLLLGEFSKRYNKNTHIAAVLYATQTPQYNLLHWEKNFSESSSLHTRHPTTRYNISKARPKAATI